MRTPLLFRPLLCALLAAFPVSAQSSAKTNVKGFDLSDFYDSAHHWYDITDEVPKLITPQTDQKKYDKTQIAQIADNILIYQRANGGWPKNYDMAAILTDEQRTVLLSTKEDISLTTFDNGATHSQIAYLVKAYKKLKDERYRTAAEAGIRFILSAQYPNGGLPQFYPDTSGYRKYITFNDGAMLGVVRILYNISIGAKEYAFVGPELRAQASVAYAKALACILQCQIRVNGTLTAWCQQHDHRDLRPQNARTFEPIAICSMESADIVQFLMTIDKPSPEVVTAVNAAVAWFRRSSINGVRVETVKAAHEDFKYHQSDDDRVVVQDAAAPPVWTRMYEVDTNRPMFCRRDGHTVYTLAEVERERRTGYKWYCYEPAEVLARFPEWKQRSSPNTPE